MLRVMHDFKGLPALGARQASLRRRFSPFCSLSAASQLLKTLSALVSILIRPLAGGKSGGKTRVDVTAFLNGERVRFSKTVADLGNLLCSAVSDSARTERLDLPTSGCRRGVLARFLETFSPNLEQSRADWWEQSRQRRRSIWTAIPVQPRCARSSSPPIRPNFHVAAPFFSNPDPSSSTVLPFSLCMLYVNSRRVVYESQLLLNSPRKIFHFA